MGGMEKSFSFVARPLACLPKSGSFFVLSSSLFWVKGGSLSSVSFAEGLFASLGMNFDFNGNGGQIIVSLAVFLLWSNEGERSDLPASRGTNPSISFAGFFLPKTGAASLQSSSSVSENLK